MSSYTLDCLILPWQCCLLWIWLINHYKELIMYLLCAFYDIIHEEKMIQKSLNKHVKVKNEKNNKMYLIYFIFNWNYQLIVDVTRNLISHCKTQNLSCTVKIYFDIWSGIYIKTPIYIIIILFASTFIIYADICSTILLTPI